MKKEDQEEKEEQGILTSKKKEEDKMWWCLWRRRKHKPLGGENQLGSISLMELMAISLLFPNREFSYWGSKKGGS